VCWCGSLATMGESVVEEEGDVVGGESSALVSHTMTERGGQREGAGGVSATAPWPRPAAGLANACPTASSC